MGKLKDIYVYKLKNAKTQDVPSSIFADKPIMVNDLLSPDSTICIQPTFNVKFKLDEEGMGIALDMLEARLEARSEQEKKNLLNILTDVYETTQDYLGGYGDQEIRQEAYLDSEHHELTLSYIQEEKIGLCTERASLAHQMLLILEEEGTIHSYTSYLTNSHMVFRRNIESHSFIILKHKTDNEKQYIFDIENPIQYKLSADGEPKNGLALYPISEKEFNDFKNGKNIEVKSIYENIGYLAVGSVRSYGNENIELLNKRQLPYFDDGYR